MCTSAVKRWLVKSLSGGDMGFEDKVDYLAYYYEFFYNLETLLQLV